MNATELGQYHEENVYKAIVEGKMDPKVGKEANNALGKRMLPVRAQLEAISLSKEKPENVRKAIPFLE